MDRDEDDIDDRYYGKGLRKASGIFQNLMAGQRAP